MESEGRVGGGDSVGYASTWGDSSKKIDVHGSVHRNINLIERTNKMRLCSRIYYSNAS